MGVLAQHEREAAGHGSFATAELIAQVHASAGSRNAPRRAGAGPRARRPATGTGSSRILARLSQVGAPGRPPSAAGAGNYLPTGVGLAPESTAATRPPALAEGRRAARGPCAGGCAKWAWNSSSRRSSDSQVRAR